MHVPTEQYTHGASHWSVYIMSLLFSISLLYRHRTAICNIYARRASCCRVDDDFCLCSVTTWQMHHFHSSLTLWTIYTKYDSQYSNKQYPCTHYLSFVFGENMKTNTNGRVRCTWCVPIFVWCTFVTQMHGIGPIFHHKMCSVCMTRHSMALVAQLTRFRLVTLALVFFSHFYCFVALACNVCVVNQ